MKFYPNTILKRWDFSCFLSSQSSQIVDWRAEGLREWGPQNTKALSPSSAFR